MASILPLVFLALLASPAYSAHLSSFPDASEGDDDLYKLPPDFLYGAGVSAVQTEGAWNVSGKGESAADHVIHTGKLTHFGFLNPHLQDTAANSYNRFKEDIAAAAALKLNLYRFSISWSRVLPEADSNKPNPEGVQFYHDFIDEILKYNMTPFATLYHFDHPWKLEADFKGWQGEQMVAKFEEYARFVFQQYSSKVKLWATINEPNMYCNYFPSLFLMAELYTPADMDMHKCIRHTILAHAKSYRAFQAGGYSGQVGFTALMVIATPNSTRTEDVYATEAFNQMNAGIIFEPVIKGDYPEIVKQLSTKLIPFSDAEKELIKGTTDFLGFNIYWGVKVSYVLNSSDSIWSHVPVLSGLTADMPFLSLDIDGGLDMKNPLSMFSMITPASIRNAMMWLWTNYKLPLIITENGMSDVTGMGINDHQRAAYHSAYLRAAVKTMNEFKAKVLGYCAWSLIDAFEWRSGFAHPFGLVHVDYEGGSLNRTLKASSKFWTDMAETGIVPLVEPSYSSHAVTISSSLLLLIAGLWTTLVRLL